MSLTTERKKIDNTVECLVQRIEGNKWKKMIHSYQYRMGIYQQELKITDITDLFILLGCFRLFCFG